MAQKIGSPPLTRGKEIFVPVANPHKRITPAYAGKSAIQYFHFVIHGDHPRLRGEKRILSSANSRLQGSPPLTRGKASATCPAWEKFRITPAYAGKREQIGISDSEAQDHPRLRGEKSLQQRLKLFIPGSPPLTRGKVSSGRVEHRRCRDHPRLRGEKS